MFLFFKFEILARDLKKVHHPWPKGFQPMEHDDESEYKYVLNLDANEQSLVRVCLLGIVPAVQNFTWWYLGPNVVKRTYSWFPETIQYLVMI